VVWIVRLVSIGAEGEEHSTDVMRIARPGDLTDLAALGLTLAEGKRLLAGVQREGTVNFGRGLAGGAMAGRWPE
jgi:hypothetical protein